MERPILFSGEMVRAILDGRKTQTRRVVKPPSHIDPNHFDIFGASFYPLSTFVHWPFDDAIEEKMMPCPYGKPGDKLWVRETWAAVHFKEAYEEGYALGYCDGWEASDTIPENSGDGYWTSVYAATDSLAQDSREERGFSWRPSIHMPRWASRITLEVVNVRVERLQDISEGDALAEGLVSWESEKSKGTIHYGIRFSDVWETDPRLTYKRLWDSINAARGYSWDSNPWVWIVEFKKA